MSQEDTSCHHRTITLAPVSTWGRSAHWLCVTCGNRVDCTGGGNHGRQRQEAAGWVCIDCGRQLLPPAPLDVVVRRPADH